MPAWGHQVAVRRLAVVELTDLGLGQSLAAEELIVVRKLELPVLGEVRAMRL